MMNNDYINTLRKKNYGIVSKKELPDFKYEDKKLDTKDIHWAIMDDFSDLAKNHCAPTFITNLAIYFQAKGYENLLIDNDIKKTFTHIHKMTGNGPVITTARTAKKYFFQRGYRLKYETVKSFSEIKKAIDDNMPISLLIMKSIFSWHWVMGIGYLDSKDYDFVRIINAWDDTDERYYLINEGALFISAKKYQIVGEIEAI